MNKKIIKRKYYAIDIVLTSPLSVSSGEDYYSDSDVIRNADGELFIPGTSLAGAFRNRLNLESKMPGIMGYSDGEEGAMSAINISDLYLENGVVSIRDGVKLKEDHTVDDTGKFDMEIIETGASGTIFLDYVLRENMQEAEMEEGIGLMIQGLQNGDIRLGSNKNRGFGRVTVQKISTRSFEKDVKNNVTDWILFCKSPSYMESHTFEQWQKKWAETYHKAESCYLKITVPLKLQGGISIRKYSAAANQADYQHLTCNGNPIIPGSSWNGAIQSDARNILREVLTCMGRKKNVQNVIDTIFGYVNLKQKKAHQSDIVISESILEGSQRQIVTRNKINRFDASTKKGALYTEESWFGGRTNLEFLVKKNENLHMAVGLLSLIISDIQKGYVPVGGLVSVGRGIFEADGEITYSEEIDLKECNYSLYNCLLRSESEEI